MAGCSPPGSSVNEISQARILEWVAIPSPRDLPDPGFKPRSPALQVDSLPTELQEKQSIFLAKGKLNSLGQKKESHCIR